MADTLQMHLYVTQTYIWAKGHPGRQPPNRKVTLYSEIAHRQPRKRHTTDGMNAQQIKQYILNKL